MSEPLKAGRIFLDLDDFYDLTTKDTSIVQALRQAAYVVRDQPTEWAILTQLGRAIEAQIKPARIPEPTLWGVVEATRLGWHRGQWVHCDGDVWRSLRDDGHEWVAWTSLVDPTLIREGVTQ